MCFAAEELDGYKGKDHAPQRGAASDAPGLTCQSCHYPRKALQSSRHQQQGADVHLRQLGVHLKRTSGDSHEDSQFRLKTDSAKEKQNSDDATGSDVGKLVQVSEIQAQKSMKTGSWCTWKPQVRETEEKHSLESGDCEKLEAGKLDEKHADSTSWGDAGRPDVKEKVHHDHFSKAGTVKLLFLVSGLQWEGKGVSLRCF